MAAKLTRPCDSTRGERPALIKYLEATALIPKSIAAPRQARTPLVVMEMDILAPVQGRKMLNNP
jgi:hypothetical protein